MAISVFLSRPTPHEENQQKFLEQVGNHLKRRGLAPRTIGETDYGRMPMPHIRGVMTDCNGLLGLAFRRFHVIQGEDRPGQVMSHMNLRVGQNRGKVDDQWMTTPYLHLETAIAYQLGIPILLFVEQGVIQEGAMEPGVLVQYPPVFDLSSARSWRTFLASQEWRQLMDTWAGEVREVVYNKGQPPRLFHRGS